MTATRLLHPVQWMLVCILAQLYGAYGEILDWHGFSESVLRLCTHLGGNFEGGKCGGLSTGNERALDVAWLLSMNQGFYNLFIVAGILLALLPWLDVHARRTLGIFALCCMAAAGGFGLVTVAFSEHTVGVDKLLEGNFKNIAVFSLQAVLPIIALIGLRLRGWQIG